MLIEAPGYIGASVRYGLRHVRCGYQCAVEKDSELSTFHLRCKLLELQCARLIEADIDEPL